MECESHIPLFVVVMGYSFAAMFFAFAIAIIKYTFFE